MNFCTRLHDMRWNNQRGLRIASTISRLATAKFGVFRAVSKMPLSSKKALRVPMTLPVKKTARLPLSRGLCVWKKATELIAVLALAALVATLLMSLLVPLSRHKHGNAARALRKRQATTHLQTAGTALHVAQMPPAMAAPRVRPTSYMATNRR